MIKITFVYPDYENLGTEYLMAVCLREGYDVDFVYYEADDTSLGIKKKAIPYKEIAERIIKTNPHIVAFSCVTDNYQYQLGVAKALKTKASKLTTIFGGIHPTALPKEVLKNEEVDCIAIGEGEISFVEFLNTCECENNFILPNQPTRGIVFKRNGTTIGDFVMSDFVDLDSLPAPNKELFASQLNNSIEGYRIITSRGCPNKCTYCFNSFYYTNAKKRVRQRSVDHVINELKTNKANSKYKYVLFLDDCFTTNSKWLLEFCERYKQEIGLPFSCSTAPLYMNRKKIKALHSAGCTTIHIGIQSIDENLCKSIFHRSSSNSQIADVIKIIKEVGIMVQIDHMLGIPGDTIKQQEKSILFYNKLRPHLIGTYWLTYYPKTTIFELACQNGTLKDFEIEIVKQGQRISFGSFYTHGDVEKNPDKFYSIAFLLNYLPILPRSVVSLLVKSRFYRIFKTSNFIISIALPRSLNSIINKQDYKGREHINRFLNKVFLLLKIRKPKVMKQGKTEL